VLARAATTPAHLQGEAVAINRGEGIESNGHWSWEGETRASLEQQYSRKALFPEPVTKLYETWRLSMRKGPRRPIRKAFSLTNC
jgi:hypothetical protein